MGADNYNKIFKSANEPQGQQQQIDKKSIAVQALNDPDATPEEQAQARKILGM